MIDHIWAVCDGRCGQPYGCNVCNLSICSVCDGAEGSLTTECPKIRVPFDIGQAVYDEGIDFKNGRWTVHDKARNAFEKVLGGD